MLISKSRVKRALRRVPVIREYLGTANGTAPNPTSDWTDILRRNAKQWNAAKEAAKGGPRVLIATSTGGAQAITPVESMLAVALTLRGANVHISLCDKFLPACMEALSTRFPDQQEFLEHGPRQSLCDNCFPPGSAIYGPLGLQVHRYSTLVSELERAQARELASSVPCEDIAGFQLDGLAIGEHAQAGALRFFARGTLDSEPSGEAVLRRYFEAALLATFATRELVRTQKFDIACFHHGIYVPQGLIGEVARRENVRVINWSAAYRKKCFIFSQRDTYHHTLMDEPTSAWENMHWTPALEAGLLDYLQSRWEGSRDWISFHEKPELELAVIAKELGIDFSLPTVGLLTNVIWDAQLHYPANAFPNMRDWLLRTIQYFKDRPEVQLVIRVHPAEIRGTVPSRQPVVEEIRQAFPTLPPNVFVIPPESPVSTYTVMLQCNSVIIYGTKTGVELSSYGVPVIVGGEAWIRNKGVTKDASTIDGYLALLDELPVRQRMDETVTRRARMYAYHFFFRRMIPVKAIAPHTGWPPYRLDVSDLDELMPGRDAGLDVICRGILEGTDFIFPAETLGTN